MSPILIGRTRVRRGFTLMEAALATVIVGVGVVALTQLIAAGTAANTDGARMTTAMNFARNVREHSLTLSYSQVRALNNQTYSPPIDSRGSTLTDFAGWSQTVTVQAVDINRLTADVASVSPSAVRVTATVNRGTSRICDLSWYAFAPVP